MFYGLVCESTTWWFRQMSEASTTNTSIRMPLLRPLPTTFIEGRLFNDWTGNSLQGWKLLSFYTPHKLDTCLWWNCLDTVCCRFLPRNEFFRQTCSFWDQLKHASFKEHFNKHKPWIHQGWLINPMFNVEVAF